MPTCRQSKHWLGYPDTLGRQIIITEMRCVKLVTSTLSEIVQAMYRSKVDDFPNQNLNTRLFQRRTRGSIHITCVRACHLRRRDWNSSLYSNLVDPHQTKKSLSGSLMWAALIGLWNGGQIKIICWVLRYLPLRGKGIIQNKDYSCLVIMDIQFCANPS